MRLSDLSMECSNINKLGYQFNLEQIVSDINTLLSNSKVKLTETSISTNVTKYIRDIEKFLVDETLIRNIVTT